MEENNESNPDSPLSRAIAALKTLCRYYNRDTGLFNTTNWWNSANALTTIADFVSLSPSLDGLLDGLLANSFQQAQLRPWGFVSFLNDFYDDEGWWALLWLKVYEWRHQEEHLQAAVDIFQDMMGGWGGKCGGLWWNKEHKVKGAIENELFLAVAARLAIVVEDQTQKEFYLQWALKQWKWFQGTEMINGDSTINNGINADTCKNDGSMVWTYNQGVILGALVSLNEAAPDPSYLQTAERIALAAIKRLTDKNGILHEPGEPNLGNDGPQFKGIFVRNLHILHAAQPREEFKDFFKKNADSIWKNRGENDNLGVVWSSPTTDATAATHSSACDALVAALAVA